MATIEQQRRLREAARNERRRRKATGSPNSAYVKVYEPPTRPISKTPIQRPDRPISKTPIQRPDRPISVTPTYNGAKQPTVVPVMARTKPVYKTKVAPQKLRAKTIVTTVAAKKLNAWATNAGNNERLAKKRMLKASRK